MKGSANRLGNGFSSVLNGSPVDPFAGQEWIDDSRDLRVGRGEQVCGFHLDPGHDHWERFVIRKFHPPAPRQIFLEGGFRRFAEVNCGERVPCVVTQHLKRNRLVGNCEPHS